jgi:diacylglycerol kinase family enzyme
VRLLLVVNSSASSVTPRTKVVIQKALSADHEVTVAETNRRGHATRLAQGAANDGADVVVCLGGDGTLNEVANGLAGTATALAPLPGGSTNVFARTIGLPNDPIEATGVLLEGLAKGCIEPVGLGSVNGRYFLFHVGIGYDAAVVEQVEKWSTIKRWAGHPLFLYSAIATWVRHYDHSRPRLAVHLADGTVVADGYMAVCMNTHPYTYLGNRAFDLCKDATLDRGLAVITVRTMKLWRVARTVASGFGLGPQVGRLHWVSTRVDQDVVTVVGHGPVPFQVDGDYLGDTDRLELAKCPGVLRLVLPANVTDDT